MGQTLRFQETLRRLAMIDESFVHDEAGLGLGLARISALDHKTAALLQLGVSVATGSPAVCLEWCAGRALAAGATEDEIADVLLAIAPVAGLGRVVCAAPGVATALGYDIEAAMEEPGDPLTPPAGHVNLTNAPATAKEAGMAARDQRGDGWTAILWRQPARIAEGRPEGSYTDVFEIISCDCGDHPGLEYRNVSSEFQLVRGPYPMKAGLAAYAEHLGLHQQNEAAYPPGVMTDAG